MDLESAAVAAVLGEVLRELRENYADLSGRIEQVRRGEWPEGTMDVPGLTEQGCTLCGRPMPHARAKHPFCRDQCRYDWMSASRRRTRAS